MSRRYSFVTRSITSAAVIRMTAYESVHGGYDEYLFVDYVDFDFSVKMRQRGYRILSMNDVVLEHELGNSKWKRILFKRVRYTANSSQREYYIARNIVVFIHRYWRTESVLRDRLSLIKHYVYITLFDEQRGTTLRALNNGFRDGIKRIRMSKQGR